MLKTAVKAARAAGRVLLEGSMREIDVERRMRRDVKLALDRKAEETIIEILREAFPQHAILSEECGRVAGRSEYEWVIDPLDGSYNFLRRIPLWVTSIGLRKNGEEVLGVIYDPVRDELFCAEKGGGAFLNDRPIRVSDTRKLEQATVAFACSPHEENVEHTARIVAKVVLVAEKIRELGSAAMHMAYVACGRMDAFLEHGIWPWDIAAGTVLIRETGGKVVTRRHEKGSVDIICSNGRIQDELADYVAWGRRRER